MLSSLLPGLREIRAPLAAGYLWLVSGWVLLHDRIETGPSASGTVDALTELRDAIGLGGLAAAATFVAYLLGALWEPIAVWAARALWSARASLKAWRKRRLERWAWKPVWEIVASHNSEPALALFHLRTEEDNIKDGYDGSVPPRAYLMSREAWRQLNLIGVRLVEGVDAKMALGEGRIDSAERGLFLSKLRQTLSQVINNPVDMDAKDDLKELEGGSPRDLWWVREASDFARLMEPADALVRMNVRWKETSEALVKLRDESYVRAVGAPEVTRRLFGDLELMARRLVGEQQELVLEASRMKGEVEFRYALAVPLPIAVSVMAFGLGMSTWTWVLATTGGVLAGIGLLTDGWRRDAARNNFLVELLAIGKGESPTFVRLIERAQQAMIDSPGAPIDEVGVREKAESGAEQPAEDAAGDDTAGARAARSP